MTFEEIVIAVLLVSCAALAVKLSSLKASPPRIVFRKPKYMLHPGYLDLEGGNGAYVGYKDLIESYQIDIWHCAMHEEGTSDYKLKRFIHLFPDPSGEYRIHEAVEHYLRGELPANVFSK